VRRIATAIVAAAVAVAIAAPDARGKTKHLTAWLDADAPIVIAVRPAWIEGFVAQIKDLGSGVPELEAGLGWLSAGTVAVLGFDLLSKAGWQRAGFAGDAPMVIAVAAIDDGDAEKVYDDLFAAKQWNDKKLKTVNKVYWRTRAVVGVSDAPAVDATVRHMTNTIPDLYEVRSEDAEQIAMMLGEAARKSDKVVRRLRKRKFLAIGWISGLDAVIAMRMDDKQRVLVIDVVATFAGVPTVWPRDSRKLLAALERSPGNSKLPAVLARGAGAGALDSGLAVWIQPTAMIETAKASGRNRALRALAYATQDDKIRRAMHKQASSEIARCDEFRELAGRGPFVDVAFTNDLQTSGAARASTWRARWGLRKGYKLGAAMMVADDGLMTWGKPNNAVIVAAHYLDGLGLLRSLPRPKVMDRGFDELGEAIHQCGGASAALTAMVGWPQLTGMLLDEMRASDPDVARIVDGLRNGALVITKLAEDRNDIVAAGAATFEDPAAGAIQSLVTKLGGKGAKKTIAKRAVTAWTVDALRVAAFNSTDGQRAFAATTGKRALQTLLGAVGTSKDPPIARWTVDVPRLIDQFGAIEPDSKTALAPLGKKIERADGTLDLVGNDLVAEFVVKFR
jgi:hypothetical protein